LNLPSGLIASLSYDPNDAYLTLLAPQDGAIHASLVGAYVEDERLIRDAVLDHLLVSADGVRVWGEGFTAYGTMGTANPLQQNHSGFIAGVDMPLGDGVTAGVAGAYTNYKASMPSHASRAVGETGHIVGYLGWSEDPSGGWMLKGGGEYGWGVAAINRVSGIDSDSNHESANTAQIFGEAAFRDHFEGADLEPHADIIWVQTQNGAFRETGGSTAMNGNAVSENATLARFGVRGLGRYIDLGSGIEVAPSLDIGWQVALSAPTPGLTASFNNGAGSALLTGAPVAVNAGTAQLGMAIKLGDDADLHLGYDGIFSAGEVDHGVTARLEWRF
jgi:subtilase-type serine protease